MQREDRARLLGLARHVALGPVGVQRERWRARGEAGVGGRVPLEGRPAVVAGEAPGAGQKGRPVAVLVYFEQILLT